MKENKILMKQIKFYHKENEDVKRTNQNVRDNVQVVKE